MENPVTNRVKTQNHHYHDIKPRKPDILKKIQLICHVLSLPKSQTKGDINGKVSDSIDAQSTKCELKTNISRFSCNKTQKSC